MREPLENCPHCGQRLYLCNGEPCADRDTDKNGVDDAHEPVGQMTPSASKLFPPEEKGFIITGASRYPIAPMADGQTVSIECAQRVAAAVIRRNFGGDGSGALG